MSTVDKLEEKKGKMSMDAGRKIADLVNGGSGKKEPCRERGA